MPVIRQTCTKAARAAGCAWSSDLRPCQLLVFTCHVASWLIEQQNLNYTALGFAEQRPECGKSCCKWSDPGNKAYGARHGGTQSIVPWSQSL